MRGGRTGEEVRCAILAEKCPNRRVIGVVIGAAGGETPSFDEFVAKCTDGTFSAAWIAGGYPKPWMDKKTSKFAEKLELLVVQELFDSELTAAATIVLPACAWVEREGSFVNAAGLIQTFERAIDPPDGAMRDGQYLYELAGYEGIYSGGGVREFMAATGAVFEEGAACAAAVGAAAGAAGRVSRRGAGRLVGARRARPDGVHRAERCA